MHLTTCCFMPHKAHCNSSVSFTTAADCVARAEQAHRDCARDAAAGYVLCFRIEAQVSDAVRVHSKALHLHSMLALSALKLQASLTSYQRGTLADCIPQSSGPTMPACTHQHAITGTCTRRIQQTLLH